jgi:hypothetical protein
LNAIEFSRQFRMRDSGQVVIPEKRFEFDLSQSIKHQQAEVLLVVRRAITDPQCSTV